MSKTSNCKSYYKSLEYCYLVETKHRSKSEKKAKVLSAIASTLWALFSIFVTILLVMHSWNSIMPQLLKVELVQINFAQAFCFAYLFNLLFRVPESHDKKAKEDNNNKKTMPEISEDNDTTVLED